MNKITILDILFIIGIILFLLGLYEVINFAIWKNCYDNNFKEGYCEKYRNY